MYPEFMQDRLDIFLKKNIPVASGMGGGSSDAAATLRTLCRLWELDLGNKELQPLASSLGSDVSFFLFGGTAIAEGRGEEIHELPAMPTTHLVLLAPPVEMPNKTATMYAHAPPEETTKRSLEQDDIDGACALYKGFSPAQLDAVSYYEGACGDQDAVAHTDSQNTPPPDPPVVRITHGCSALPRSATSGVVTLLIVLLLSVVQRRRRLAPSPALEIRDATLGTPPEK